MPTNLPPAYYDVEKRYRAAESTSEKISLLEEMLSTIPKHKGTEHLRGDLKSRLAKLKTTPQGKRSASRHASAFHLEREGAGQAVIIGAANTGKSALLRALTHAEPQIADTPFTTWEPLPGMMKVDDVPVQLIDTPALDRDYVEPELFDLLRRTDVILLLVDLLADPFQQFEDALQMLRQHRILPAHLPQLASEDSRMVLRPVLVAANKCDDPTAEMDCHIFDELLGNEWHVLPVSAATGQNLDALKRQVLSFLNVIRVYAKPPGKEPDMSAPFILRSGSTVEQLAGMVHKDFLHHLKFARVWGKGVHDGQMVAREYILQDGDIIELRV
jgi:uncharacterized protein